MSDKFAHMSANKATNGYMIPRGFEPYVASRPYEEIDVPVAPSALLQRGTPSVITHMLGYKVLIELKRKCFEILTGIDWNEKQREDRPYMDVHTSAKPISLKESAEPTYSDSDLEYAKRNLAILESTFEMIKGSSGRYEANREYKKGDIILAGLDFSNEVNRVAFENGLIHWQENGDTPNVIYNEDVNAYVARDFIYFGEPLVI